MVPTVAGTLNPPSGFLVATSRKETDSWFVATETDMDDITLRQATVGDLGELSDLLVEVVADGASVGFMSSLTPAEAMNFWGQQLESAERRERVVLVAVDAQQGLVGTIQLVTHLPDNQPHRADIAKLQVRKRARRRGVGAKLLRFAEAEAARLQRSLLVLDTVTGSPAERFYAQLGWQRVGVIPEFALWPDGRPCDSTFFYKRVAVTSDGRG